MESDGLVRRTLKFLSYFAILISMDYLVMAIDYDLDFDSKEMDYPEINGPSMEQRPKIASESAKVGSFTKKPVQEFVYRYSHTDQDVERRLAYFREDITLNSHHYHFHSAFPFNQRGVEELITDIDRKGEHFYYVHQQLLSRYDTERLCNNLPRTVAFHNLSGPILEGYYPNFPPYTTAVAYSGRPANILLAGVKNRPEVPHGATVKDLEKWKERARQAIIAQHVYDRGTDKRVYLNNSRGIDVLGAMLQASTSSVDRDYYGNLHNVGHLMFGRVHDPEGKFGTYDAVMASASTTIRDPMFYRWHKGVSELMILHKKLLPHYTVRELSFPNIKLTGISVYGQLTRQMNQLITFTQEWKPYLQRGYDFHTSNPIRALFRFLNHEEFDYKIEVDNQSGKHVRAVVRIFLAPLRDESNNTFDFEEQRKLFVELDKFKIDLHTGPQILTRHSLDSHVTLPTKTIFRILEMVPDRVNMRMGYLGCGWPHHLLLPKGKTEGMQFTLFAMITDWNEDKTDTTREQHFGDATSYCGIYKQKYPDKRNLGFPMDRGVADHVTLETFLTPNMAATNITIFHSQQIVPLDGTFDPMPAEAILSKRSSQLDYDEDNDTEDEDEDYSNEISQNEISRRTESDYK